LLQAGLARVRVLWLRAVRLVLRLSTAKGGRMKRDRRSMDKFRGDTTSTLMSMIMTAKTRMTAEQFRSFYAEIHGHITQAWVRLRRLPPGPMRAKLVHRKIDIELDRFKSQLEGMASCKRGCYACCESTIVMCTDDEADLLASMIKRGEIHLNAEARERIVTLAAAAKPEDWRKLPREQRRCPFLGLTHVGMCGVYENRPASCRKYFVSSPPRDCEDPAGKSMVLSINMAEAMASAAINLDPGEPETMAVKLARRLR
jgi:Fe-S-cluster containining protein